MGCTIRYQLTRDRELTCTESLQLAREIVALRSELTPGADFDPRIRVLREPPVLLHGTVTELDPGGSRMERLSAALKRLRALVSGAQLVVSADGADVVWDDGQQSLVPGDDTGSPTWVEVDDEGLLASQIEPPEPIDLESWLSSEVVRLVSAVRDGTQPAARSLNAKTTAYRLLAAMEELSEDGDPYEGLKVLVGATLDLLDPEPVVNTAFRRWRAFEDGGAAPYIQHRLAQLHDHSGLVEIYLTALQPHPESLEFDWLLRGPARKAVLSHPSIQRELVDALLEQIPVQREQGDDDACRWLGHAIGLLAESGTRDAARLILWAAREERGKERPNHYAFHVTRALAWGLGALAWPGSFATTLLLAEAGELKVCEPCVEGLAALDPARALPHLHQLVRAGWVPFAVCLAAHGLPGKEGDDLLWALHAYPEFYIRNRAHMYLRKRGYDVDDVVRADPLDQITHVNGDVRAAGFKALRKQNKVEHKLAYAAAANLDKWLRARVKDDYVTWDERDSTLEERLEEVKELAAERDDQILTDKVREVLELGAKAVADTYPLPFEISSEERRALEEEEAALFESLGPTPYQRQPVTAAPEEAEPAKPPVRRFEMTAGSSSKFWEIGVEGSAVTTRWGRIGAKGQTKTKALGSTSAAQADAEKQIRAKVKKGYEEIALASPDTAAKSSRQYYEGPLRPEADDHLPGLLDRVQDDYGEDDEEDEWANNLLSKAAVLAPSGRVCGPEESFEPPIPEELALCQRLAKEAEVFGAALNIPCSEGPDALEGYYVARSANWRVADLSADSVAGLFGSALCPDEPVDVQPLDELAPWWQEVLDYYDEYSTSVLEGWRRVREWFLEQPEFVETCWASVGSVGFVDMHGGCVSLRLLLGRTEAGSVTGLVGISVGT